MAMQQDEPANIFLGFDPGGQGNFGWSICHEVNGVLQPPAQCQTGVANDALDALNRVKCHVPKNAIVCAAGIDAPLFWGEAGNRQIEPIIRKALKAAKFPSNRLGGTVQEVNSLQGACLAQGLILADLLHHDRDLPDLMISECHPKALAYLLNRAGQYYDETAAMAMELIAPLADGNQRATTLWDRFEFITRGPEHERDATLSAISGWAGHRDQPHWQNLYLREPNPRRPFGTCVSFWMPIAPNALPVKPA